MPDSGTHSEADLKSELKPELKPDIQYLPDFLALAEADLAFRQLLAETPWQQGEIKLFGRLIAEPRLSAWYGDPDAHYRYSGQSLSPIPWTPVLIQLKAYLKSVTQAEFNSVLLNLYRDGQDSMGLHSDDEPELGPEPLIASISLGASRRFVLRHKQSGQRHELNLAHGSLLLMSGRCQHDWKHGLPKDKRCTEPRINLTFRRVSSA